MTNQLQFDVFLAHNSLDKSEVRTIATKLKHKNIKVWLDDEQIPPGQSFQDLIQQAIQNVKSAAIFIGSNGLGRWQKAELLSLFCQFVNADIPVIPVLLPGVNSIPADLPFLQNLTSVAFANTLDDDNALKRLVWGITQQAPIIKLPNDCKVTSTTSTPMRDILQNLPAPTYNEFIGREEEIALLLKRLSPSHAAHIISVDGIGGVGKTALVLEAAYKCLKASRENLSDFPIFDAIIFTSAKQSYLIPNGILLKSQIERNLRDIFREIANTLNDPTITQSTSANQFESVRQALAKQRTLLIVDNMEAVEDEKNVIAFLYDLPANIKVVFTTRKRIALLPISLQHLPEEDGLKLVKQQAEENNIILSDDDSQKLYKHTGGIPLAIIYVIGQVFSGYSLESVLKKLVCATGDVARFCFEESVQGIKNQPPHKLLMSLAIFPEPPLRSAVAEVAGLTALPDAVNDGLALLQTLSLVTEKERRYSMLSLTREYALAELAAYPDFEREVRARWVKWYINFASEYGGEDWKNWTRYDNLQAEEENLLAVLDWCQDQDRYEDIRDLWQLLNHYANLFGYWDDCLERLQWLIEASERHGEWSSWVKVIIYKSWLLIRMSSDESLSEADKILRQAWNLRESTDYCTRADLAESFVRLEIRRKNYPDAREWLKEEENFVNQANLEERQKIRFLIPISYHKAEILFWKKNMLKPIKYFKRLPQMPKKLGGYG